MRKIRKERNETSSAIDGFIKGMGSLSLFPQLPNPEPETSPWQGVGDAFAAAGENLRFAIDKVKCAQGLT